MFLQHQDEDINYIVEGKAKKQLYLVSSNFYKTRQQNLEKSARLFNLKFRACVVHYNTTFIASVHTYNNF